MQTITKRAFGFIEVALMFGVSRDSIKRLWRHGQLATITIGGRRLVPLREIERIEREGIGVPRVRKVKSQGLKWQPQAKEFPEGRN